MQSGEAKDPNRLVPPHPVMAWAESDQGDLARPGGALEVSKAWSKDEVARGGGLGDAILQGSPQDHLTRAVADLKRDEVVDDAGSGGFSYRFRAEVKPEVTPSGYLTALNAS